uniref:NADH-ubiquinone oxidoreductase chain 2 n=1 Tax=Perinereis cultrifera TaxID=59559 RepID=A0A7G8JTL6_PERCL|nr:NADH dehydrogenase subunit 2 [Perinereis cultrifera]QNJ33914.1 NADH dehydrogenase subunit 2 [Perinereis cultrifera]
MTPSSLLFTLTLFMGTLISLSSTNWLYLWTGMELNLLSFIPLIASSHRMQETEAGVKYFIVQAMGSGLMLTAGIMATNSSSVESFHFFIPMIFFTSMILKLGAAPCHQWLPHVMSSISWGHCLILATWQKVSPLIMVTFIMPRNFYFMIFIIAGLSAIVGGLGGLNQSQMRPLLAYSSIGHMGWILSTIQCSSNLFLVYFMTYIVISFGVISLLMKNNITMNKVSNSMTSMNSFLFMMIMLTLFSLGGLPPFLGFIPKWLIIADLASKQMLVLVSLLITGSLINLFYYFNITFNFILSNPQTLSRNNMSIYPILITLMCTVTSFIILL